MNPATWSPGIQPRYYYTVVIGGWLVMARVREDGGLRMVVHSEHKTREEAEAVALALNALSK